MNNFYSNIHSLFYESNCTCITEDKWDQLMEGNTRADKYKINKLVKEFLPDLFNDLALNEVPLKKLGNYNPYNYFKTKTHLILVHSCIEYFLKIN